MTVVMVEVSALPTPVAGRRDIVVVAVAWPPPILGAGTEAPITTRQASARDADTKR